MYIFICITYDTFVSRNKELELVLTNDNEKVRPTVDCCLTNLPKSIVLFKQL